MTHPVSLENDILNSQLEVLGFKVVKTEEDIEDMINPETNSKDSFFILKEIYSKNHNTPSLTRKRAYKDTFTGTEGVKNYIYKETIELEAKRKKLSMTFYPNKPHHQIEISSTPPDISDKVKREIKNLEQQNAGVQTKINRAFEIFAEYTTKTT